MGGEFNIEGVWVNRMTGQSIRVRNTIIDGDDMIILTDDGQRITMNEFQNYIQVGDEEYDLNGKAVGKTNNEMSTNFKELESGRHVVVNTTVKKNTETLDNSMFEKPLNNMNTSTKTIEQSSKVKVEESSNMKLLKKLFEKIELNLDVKVNIECDNFPTNELNMLIDIYDVAPDEITDYIIKNVISDDKYRQAITNFIVEKINTI